MHSSYDTHAVYEKLIENSSYIGTTGCYIYNRSKRQGYGRITFLGRSIAAHRFAFGIEHGTLPPLLRHTCDNPACWNADHLIVGQQVDNIRDMIQRGRCGTIGSRHYAAKLSEEDIPIIRSLLNDGNLSHREIAALYGVSKATITHINTGLKWGHVMQEAEIQTFLPLPDFAASARVLDWRRLGKQRAETIQILRTIRGETEGYKNHPAVNMWRGYDAALINYGIDIAEEWRRRGYYDTTLDYFLEKLAECPDWDDSMSPYWLGLPEFHASHRAALLAKDPAHYGQFGWSEAPGINYVWPAALEVV